jgi:hypothetical protein
MTPHGSAHIARTRDTWERSYGLHLVILESPCLALHNTLTCRKSNLILTVQSATALYINQPRPLTSQPITHVLINPPRKSRVPTLPFAVHLNILNSQYSHHPPYQESRQDCYELDLTVLLTATTNHSSPLGRSAERLDVVNRSQSSTTQLSALGRGIFARASPTPKVVSETAKRPVRLTLLRHSPNRIREPRKSDDLRTSLFCLKRNITSTSRNQTYTNP